VIATSDIDALSAAIRAGDRKALARAITLVESTRAADRARAEKLLTALLPATGKALRIGISGAPGAGKSTFIEALGEHVTARGNKLAVLAVDPSSRRSGGSILGDKTRMSLLARDPRAFIRPTPSGTTAGGVARRTRETILLGEAASYDVVFVETVGVGQSEAAVAGMVDLFVLLIAPAGGDELQGIKRGVMEFADLVVITKADGHLAGAASSALADYRGAQTLLRPKYPGVPARIVKTSAMTGAGIAETWDSLQEFAESLRMGGHLVRLRREQTRGAFWREVEAELIESVAADPAIAAEAAALEAEVMDGKALPEVSARALVRAFRRLDGAEHPP
jgi:LAO/AO transport system kinase